MPNAPHKRAKRKPTKQEKRRKKEAKQRLVEATARKMERFLAQFSPDVQEHLKGEFFKKIEERKALRRQQAT